MLMKMESRGQAGTMMDQFETSPETPVLTRNCCVLSVLCLTMFKEDTHASGDVAFEASQHHLRTVLAFASKALLRSILSIYATSWFDQMRFRYVSNHRDRRLDPPSISLCFQSLPHLPVLKEFCARTMCIMTR